MHAENLNGRDSTGLAPLAVVNDVFPHTVDIQADILSGLTADQKHISPKYFYDQRGSELFDEICRLPEYYLTRTELKLMDQHLDEIAELVGPRVSVIELGAGSNQKVRKLFDHLIEPSAYVPVEISPEYLLQQAEDLAADYPDVHIQPVLADFTQPFDLPEHPVEPVRNLVFFPGSTIGNLTRSAARDLLEVMRLQAKPGGAVLIGVDLRKDAAILHAAYNDSRGVTAEFNLNVLRRINAELNADFELENFTHEAVYDTSESRIEMRLISTCPQVVSIAGQRVAFQRGEFIITEYSHKYTVEGFAALARSAGLLPERTWVDDAALFSIHYMKSV